EKSLRSSPCHRSMLTLVTTAMVSSEMPRRSRSLRRRGPKVSLSDIADTEAEQFLRRALSQLCCADSARHAPAPTSLVIALTEPAIVTSLYDRTVTWCLSFHAGYRCRHSGACCTAGWAIPFDPTEAARVESLQLTGSGRLVWKSESDDQAYARKTSDGACSFYD